MAVILPFRAFRSTSPAFYIPGEENPRSLASGNYLQDPEDALFVYRQRFRFPGDDHESIRDGVMGLLNTADVLTHENVIPDRVAECAHRLQSPDANLGSLWLWCDDSESVIRPLLQIATEPDLVASDRFGCSHQIWRVADPHRIRALQTAFERKTLFLADGHHRYAAGSRLATIQIRNNTLRSLASHRLILGPAAIELSQTKPIAGTMEDFERYLACPLSGHSRCIIVTPGPEFRAMEFSSSTHLESLFPDNRILPVRGIENAIAAVVDRRASLALLVPPFAISKIEENARRGIVLPPKSTDFFPKLAAGLVVHRSSTTAVAALSRFSHPAVSSAGVHDSSSG